MTLKTRGAPRPKLARDVQRAMIAVFVAFFVGGFVFANWAARMPTIQGSLHADGTQLGLVLLFTSFGSIVAMPFAGSVVSRLGITPTMRTVVAINICGYILAVSAVSMGSKPLTAVALFITGIGMGPWDVSMNLAGTVVEQRMGRSIMPRFHALWSFGSVGGALTGALAEKLHLPLLGHFAVIGLVCLLAVWLTCGWMLPPGSEGQAEGKAPKVRAATAWLEPRTLIVGVIVLGASLTEGSANDWLALGVVKDLGEPKAVGGYALTVFLAAMTAMRLLGTPLIDKLGRVRVLRLCGSLAVVGLLIYVFSPSLWLVLIGAAIWGLGAAIGFPAGMSAASDDPLRAAARVSVVSTIGYTAFIAGPPLLGMLADHVGYRHAMLAVLIPVVVGLILAQVAAPPKAGSRQE